LFTAYYQSQTLCDEGKRKASGFGCCFSREFRRQEQLMNKKAFITLSIVIFASTIGMSILSPLMSLYVKSMSATGLWLGIMFSGFSLSRALFQPISGWMSDRYNRKLLLIIGLGAYTVLSLGYAWASNLYTLTTVRLLHGVASALVTPVAQAYVGDLIPNGKEGTYMNLFMMAMYLGMASGPFMGGILNDNYGMNMAFYVMAAFSALSFLLLVVFVPSLETKKKKGRASFATQLVVLKENRMKAVSLHLFSRSILRQGITAFLPLYAVSVLGMTTTTTGMVISVFIFTEAVSQGIVGPFADRYNKKLLVIGGSLVAAILSFYLRDMRDAAGFLILMVPIAITTSLARAAASAYSVEVGHQLNSMGASMGLSNAAQDLGMFVGPILFGWVTDTFGMPAMFFTGAITGLIAVPLIIWSLYSRPNKTTVLTEPVPVKAPAGDDGNGADN
jgi:DHA1 family multidrug resistance protein-like MFS transporter